MNAIAQSTGETVDATKKAAPSGQVSEPRQESKRLFGIVPNYRTSASLNPYTPLTTRQKFTLGARDAFDPGTLALGAIFGGFGLATNSNPSFGHGIAGYGRYAATGYADFVIGDFLTEAILPSALHQDPRYYRLGCCGWKRLRYAAGQIVLTHSDTGRVQFNYSEILGNSAAVAISNAYYADNRTAADAASKLSSQLAVDALSNILKEFWPEIQRKLTRKHRSDSGRAHALALTDSDARSLAPRK